MKKQIIYHSYKPFSCSAESKTYLQQQMMRRLEEITHIQTYSGKGVLFTQKEKKKKRIFLPFNQLIHDK